ncbi:hypothetical protein VQH23_16165 [Pararoseomonas sp. SCSIO 73927]|uniref:hypothetical protein n=1 Tax=Pararoseomonas sp. SCSIO 73927 TaxID=3114537 RepID=UPI0030CB2CCF
MSEHHPVDMPLKVATRLLIEKVGGLEAAASCTRIGKSQIANCYSPTSDQHLPIDVVCRLEEIAGEPLVTKELARRSRHRLERLDDGKPGDAMKHVAAVATEMNDVLAAMAAGMSDGRLCAEDLGRLQRELLDVSVRAAAAAAAMVPCQEGTA